MTPYGNLSGNSGVVAYDSGADFIDVQFIGGDSYRYSDRKPGRAHVAQMKQLAAVGQGLATYISRHVRNGYEFKF